MNINRITSSIAVFFALAVIIYLAVWTRSSTLNTPTVLDYDPFWFYRHAEEIEENNFHVPKWDILSYYPPGRPTEPFQGWPYTIAIFHKFLQQFVPAITLTRAAILSPLIMVGLAVIPAFFLGRLFSNSIGGIATAFFLVLTPTFLGVSMAGYSDSDAPVVFYAILSILLTVFAIKKSQENLIKSIPYIIIAIISNLLFVYNWGGGWITLLFFTMLIPGLFIFRIIEEMIHSKKFKLNLESIKTETKPIFISLLLILIVTNLIGFFLNWGSVFYSLLGGLAFTGLAGKLMLGGVFILLGLMGYIVGVIFFKRYGRIACTLIALFLAAWLIFFSKVSTEPLLVSISVAELQPLNIFTKDGFFAVANRVGFLPTILTLIVLPLLAFYKIYRKEKISYVEIFLFLWALVSFYLITRGVRFSLLFSISTAVVSGYVIGNLFIYLRNRSPILFSSIFGVIALFSLIFLSDAIQSGFASTGMILSQNWYDALDWLKANADKDSLISTWWDPGHIITGYTGLKVHADGAHCTPNDCIPYNHNIRIRDMGRIFSTNNETESINILLKYKELTPEQCEAARKKFENKMPEDACKPVSDIYLIASSDLVGKYYWLSYFGSYNEITKTGQGRNFIQLPFSGFDSSGLPTYGDVITLMQKDNQLIAVLNIPQQGIRNAVIKDIIYYQNNQEIISTYNATNNTFDGLLLVDPSFSAVILMEAAVRDSILTRLFFWNGEGLNNFILVYSNPEVKIFKAIL